ncbi:SLAM family member 5-like [Pantherophis guttatus]|uniref:SLAM family member 5-like n=1 Tax=Pantherophis guttatus TaxID=94885 RepID=A0A6P9CH44_PANGU|nr:SLAM family member 5-like [Pantherophis guttatus]
MSYKTILSLWLSLVLLGAEDVEAKVNGILGHSVTFQVKSSLPFKSISWSKIASSKSETIAVVTSGEPCGRLVPDPAYEKRVTIPEDCKGLNISHLRKEDAGRFRAVIIPSDAEKVDESFDLQIFRRLLDSEMTVTCTPDAAGNGTWKLNCSTGTWEDGVKFSWTSAVQSRDLPHWNSSILTSQDLNLNVTCAAENPVSKASTTVSLKQVCAGQTKNFYRLPLLTLLCLSKVGSLLLLGCLGLILVVKSRKAVGGERLPVRFLPEEPIPTSQGQSPQLSQPHIGRN